MSEPAVLRLPRIDLASLPDPRRPTGLFGSSADSLRRQAGDTNRALLETYLYELHPGT
jgi:hypothetical protein